MPSEDLDRLCRQALGAGVAREVFVEEGVALVRGVHLDNGLRVVVKAHGQRVPTGYLEAVQSVQRILSASGFPCPEPVAGPLPFRDGLATIETFLAPVAPSDARDPAVRALMAGTLAELVALAESLADLPGLGANAMIPAHDRLWPVPHDERFDFEGTAAGASWIDDLATAARPLRDTGRRVVGHMDWRIEHLGVRDGEVTAVYDWESLSVVPETTVVGAAAHAFTADWRFDQPQLPSLDEALGFVADYEAGRPGPFEPVERRAIGASLVFSMAYTARCEHSDALTGFAADGEPPVGSARAFLLAHGAELIRSGL